MVKLCLMFSALLALASAYPAPNPNVVGMDPSQMPAGATYYVDYPVAIDPRYYQYYQPQPQMPVHDRQRRQIGFGGLGGGMGGGMAGAQAQAQSQSMGSGVGLGMGGMGGMGGLGMGFNPYMMGIPFFG
ncbi:uncharacterized protein LOC132200978 isoform X2 [Neocloeon triangulifer]|uniref:uncharacterized protein LOC132200978 isoform X2 n=1 Tax=Neocloeon triangulifer TaxID=2078957 RepID=UPI00286EEC57|nr:uncharacterized protein LOC132200978 isoform X2 [Neocloeon triangulifer]